MSEAITIKITRKAESGAIEVWVGNKTAGELSLGEALEQVIGLLNPGLRTYPMLTRAEWRAGWAQRAKRIKQERLK